MNVRMVIPHRLMSALVALVLAAVVVAAPAPAQAVSGGGCASRSGQVGQYNWVTVQSCISLPTRNLRPDIYIGGGTYSNCYVYVDLYTNTGLKFTRIVGCANGHYGPWEYRVFPPDAGFAYTRSRVLWNGWELFRVDSPSVYWP
jgi:hypothetical protein